MTSVLIVETYADVYAAELRKQFPSLHVRTAASIKDEAVRPADADVLVAFGIAVDEDFLRKATRLTWIQSLATGVDHFLRSPSLRKDTILTSARGMHGPAMGESVVHFMLTLSRRTPQLVRDQAVHKWDRRRRWPLLCGKTAVIVGVGHSSTAVAQLLKAFGLRVIGVSRTVRQVEGFDAIVPTADLASITAEADYLINILPSTAQNAGLIDRTVLQAMKRTAYFINVGRGDTVDEEALIDCLRTGSIAGAGLDVYRTHPLPQDSPLWDLPNAFLSPHLAGFFCEYEDYVMPILMENMRLFLAGRSDEMRNRVPH
jgi:phosphoglycerate dehydrogenase-like enzyme